MNDTAHGGPHYGTDGTITYTGTSTDATYTPSTPVYRTDGTITYSTDGTSTAGTSSTGATVLSKRRRASGADRKR